VGRTGVEVFRDAVAELQRARPDLALLLTGPWPPYSFSQR
jgi:Gas vesicle synthesis protein GvpL/GvpF